MLHARPASASTAPAPLWAVLSLTFLNSLGTGALTNGIFFLTRSAYGFSALENYALGFLSGGTYMAGALLTGPVLRRLFDRFPALTERAVLAAIMIALAALCSIPMLAERLAGPGAAWSAWLLIALYSPLTGALWPITESFLSGGRSAHGLRAATGAFNVTWSAAVAAAYWLMAPLVQPAPLAVFLAVGGVHVACLAFLGPIGARPAPHDPDVHEPHPPVYRSLLALFRIELPVSYLTLSALGPYLPIALDHLAVAPQWQTPIASTWLIWRVLAFLVLQQWHGWHGRWAAAVAGGTLLLLGFAGTVLAPWIPGARLGLGLLFPSLACFGVGMGLIYTAALYYAMEVGRSQVDAGGMHEALIGVGYTAGPGCGLLACAAVSANLVGPGSLEPAILTTVTVIALPTMGLAVRHALRRAAAESPAASP